jgi:hypothetical protein
MAEHVHDLSLGGRSAAGEYYLEKEGRLEVGGRPVLYLVGVGVIDSSCCGVGGCRYAVVPGFLDRENVRRDDDGRRVSLVRPVLDPAERDEIAAKLKRTEYVQQVRFD